MNSIVHLAYVTPQGETLTEPVTVGDLWARMKVLRAAGNFLVLGGDLNLGAIGAAACKRGSDEGVQP